jgi:ribonuclease PH
LQIMRIDGRSPDQLRDIKITSGFTKYAEGSVLVEFGFTRVACTATVEPSIPKWLQNSGKGWVTAEYGMLPRSTHTRVTREKATSSGRSLEISRLIARSLRAIIDLRALGERSIVIDCDVIQADGGTRTAAITGGFVALALALKALKDRGDLSSIPLKDYVAAVSVGYSTTGPILDLKYEEDSEANTDMNIVMTGNGNFVEIQGTAEGAPFSRSDLDKMLELGQKGCKELFLKQAQIVGGIFPYIR